MDQTTRLTPHNTQTEPSAVGNRAGRNQVGPSPTELTSLRGRKPPAKSSNSPAAYRVVVNKASPLLRLDTDIGLAPCTRCKRLAYPACSRFTFHYD